MRGEILRYDDGSGTGLISGDDGNRYAFKRADLQQLKPVATGMKVDFVPGEGGNASEVFIIGGSAGAAPAQAAYAAAGLEPIETTNEDLSLWEYFKKCMEKSFDGKGRARRKEYWSFVLFELLFALGGTVLLVLVMAILSGGNESFLDSQAGETITGMVVLIFWVFSWWCSRRRRFRRACAGCTIWG